MEIRLKIRTLLLAACLAVSAFGQPSYLAFSQPQYYSSLGVSYMMRKGFVEFESIQKSVEVRRSGFLLYGFGGGFVLPLGRPLRLLLGCAFEGGSVTDDTLQTTKPALVDNFYYQISCQPALQCALSTFGRVTPFVGCGLGADLVWVKERTFFQSDPSQEVLFTDRDYVNDVSCSFTADAGIGMDIALSPHWTLFIANTFRLLYPVVYRIKEDYPLSAMNYRETLYGDVFRLGLLFGFR